MRTLLLFFGLIAFSARSQTFLTNGQVFDFSIGDVMQRHYTNSPVYITDSVAAKAFSAGNDSIFYTYIRTTYNAPTCPGCPASLITNTVYDTITQLNDPYNLQNATTCLAVADTLWLKRFALHPASFASLVAMQSHPQPTALDQVMCTTLSELTQLRATLDDVITAFCAELHSDHLSSPLEYKSTKGVVSRKRLDEVLLHFFNHQTHHRGQAHMILTVLGQPSVPLDLIYFQRTEEGRSFA